MFGLSAFATGMIAGGALIFLFPGLGTGGNAIFKNFILPFFRGDS